MKPCERYRSFLIVPKEHNDHVNLSVYSTLMGSAAIVLLVTVNVVRSSEYSRDVTSGLTLANMKAESKYPSGLHPLSRSRNADAGLQMQRGTRSLCKSGPGQWQLAKQTWRSCYEAPKIQAPVPHQVVGRKVTGTWTSLQLFCLTTVSFGFFRVLEVSGWTYHYSEELLTWNESYDLCRRNFTNMAAIQNKEEISFLMNFLKGGDSHYWIGLRKINDTWVWIGTNKSLTSQEENWAHTEPNNKKNNQDCVEIYIQRQKDSGKWNDEPCTRKKRALCYLVSCNDSSCNDHGDCIETIKNSTCKCRPGFYGANCEHAVSCRSLQSPSHGRMICSDTFGTFQYNSVCNFSCEEGFQLMGTGSLSCQNSGNWSESVPTCKAVTCAALENPPRSQMNCSHIFGEYNFKSNCEFTCEDGFQLKGSNSLLCQHSGEWSEPLPKCIAVPCMTLQSPEHGKLNCSDAFGAFRFRSICSITCEEGFELQGSSSLWCQDTGEWSEPIPTCSAVPCMTLQSPEHGKVNCSDAFGAFRFGSICNVTCEEGFELQGSSSLWCQDTGEWSELIPTCSAQNDAPETQAQVNAAAYVLPSLGLTLSGLAMAYLIRYYKKKKNPRLLKSDKDNINTFENPAFDDIDRSIEA